MFTTFSTNNPMLTSISAPVATPAGPATRFGANDFSPAAVGFHQQKMRELGAMGRNVHTDLQGNRTYFGSPTQAWGTSEAQYQGQINTERNWQNQYKAFQADAALTPAQRELRASIARGKAIRGAEDAEWKAGVFAAAGQGGGSFTVNHNYQGQQAQDLKNFDTSRSPALMRQQQAQDRANAAARQQASPQFTPQAAPPAQSFAPRPVPTSGPPPAWPSASPATPPPAAGGFASRLTDLDDQFDRRSRFGLGNF